ncbi:MAG: hypothetical protein R8M45_01855, partial [Ghiorsea sp.]
MKASDSVVDINITSVLAVNISLQGMDYYNPVTIAALPSGVDLTGSIVRDFAGNEFSCYFHTSASNTMGLAMPKGAGLALAAGAATASVRRLQGDFSGKESFNRWSTGTYIDSLTGLVKTAMPSAIRFERLADGGVGALLEGTSTNLNIHSEDFTNAAWIKAGTCNVSHTAGADPVGGTTADTINLATDTAWASNNIYQSHLGLTSSTDYTGSVWLRGAGATTVTLAIRDASTGIFALNTIAITSGWKRYEATLTTGAATTSCALVIGASDGNFVVWGGQVEALPFATSYIPTTTQAVTRAADSLSIPAQGIAALSSATLAFDADLLGNTVGWVVESEVVNLYNGNGGYGIYASGGTLFPSNFVPIGNTSRMVVRVDSASLSIWRDGVMLQTTAATGAYPFNVAAVRLFPDLYGHLRNLKIYDQTLTDAEIGAL